MPTCTPTTATTTNSHMSKIWQRLRKIYPQLKTLSYHESLEHEKEWIQFAKQVYFASSDIDASCYSDVPSHFACYHDALVWCIREALSNRTANNQNVLCNGYSLDAEGNLQLVSTHSPVNALYTEEWTRVYDAMGPVAFCTLLVRSAIFAPDGANYVQISGRPLDSVGLNSKSGFRAGKFSTKSYSDDLHMLKRSVVPKRLVQRKRPMRDSTGDIVVRFKPRFHLFGSHSDRHANIFHALSVAIPLEFGMKMNLALEGGVSSVTKTGAFVTANYRSMAFPEHVPEELYGIFAKTLSRHANLPYAKILCQICPNMDKFSTMNQVSHYCCTIIKRLIPKKLFGSDHNWQCICSAIARFVHLRFNEEFHLAFALEGVKTKDIPWFSNTNDLFLKHQRILYQLIHWLFRRILTPLLCACFYITPHTSEYNSMYYYRHDVWDFHSNCAQEQFCALKLQRVRESLARSSNLGIARLHITAKANGGFRPITAMGSRRAKFRNKTVNARLEVVFRVLNKEMNKITDTSRVKSSADFMEKVTKFRRPGQKYYCVKVDIDKCFDTIPAHVAMQCAENLLMYETYQLEDHKLMDMNRPRLVAKKSSIVPPHGIVLSNSVSRRIRRSEILDLLREHLFSSYVRTDSRHIYRQAVGIPQGSILSTLLCNLVYDQMEREYLPHVSSSSRLFRYVDDFLFVTTDFNKAQWFLRTMQQGIPKYGARVSRAKTQCNFGPQPKHRIVYIGTTVDAGTLCLKDDAQSKLLSSSTAQSFAIGPRPSNPLKKILDTIKGSVKLRAKMFSFTKPHSVRRFSLLFARKYLFMCTKAMADPNPHIVNKVLQKLYVVIVQIVGQQCQQLVKQGIDIALDTSSYYNYTIKYLRSAN